MGRVTFDDVTDLGIELDGRTQNIGSVLSFENVKFGKVRLYNASKAGTVTFTITFSGASNLIAGAIAMASLSALTAF